MGPYGDVPPATGKKELRLAAAGSCAKPRLIQPGHTAIMRPDCSKCGIKRMIRVRCCCVAGAAAFALRDTTKDKELARLLDITVFRCTRKSDGHRC
jgi:hypothetical protein